MTVADEMQAIEDCYVRVGERTLEHRMRSGMTQAELATKVALGRASIANIETGRQRVMLHQIEAIAAAFGVPIQDIIGMPDVSASYRVEKLRTALIEVRADRDRMQRTLKSISELAALPPSPKG